MGKQGSAAGGSDFLRELVRADFYKPNQGQIARKATLGALIAILGVGVWRLAEYLRVTVSSDNPGLVYGLPIVLLAVGVWVCFRVNNYQRFADFLIAVEGEMYKVSWPAWPTLVRSALVVILLIFFMAFALFLFDIFWRTVFRAAGIVS